MAYISAISREVLRPLEGRSQRDKIVALRDYVRAHVSNKGYPKEGRPFLRMTAAEILRSGKGWCGESVRAFVQLSHAAGIRAQRINLAGKSYHVVSEVEVSEGVRVIVDPSNPPLIDDMLSIDTVIDLPQYDDYYSINLRRLRLHGLVTRIKLNEGIVTGWFESPHLMKATLWLLAGLLLVVKRASRTLVRWALHQRGWVHVSDLYQLGYERRQPQGNVGVVRRRAP